MNNMKRNACQKCAFAVRDDNPHCGLRGFTTSFNVEWCSAENDKAPNGYELQEDGYFSWVVKKKEYPKTYEECCELLSLGEDGRLYTKGYKASLIQNFQKLLICRDAYWKIAGDEMGLGEPWKPDWSDASCSKYIIDCFGGEICKGITAKQNTIFAFPTEEMRDAFKENFDPDLEICKELL